MRVSDDRMAAWAEVAPGDDTGSEQLAAALTRATVVFGLLPEVCRLLTAVLADPDAKADATLIAMGGVPVRGIDGYFSPAFEPGIRPGHMGEHGKMDCSERYLS